MVRTALIVEDHPIVTESLKKIINDSEIGLSCIHASTGKKGLATLNGNRVDIVLLDINLPDINGMQFCSEARSRYPNIKILALTSLSQRFVVEQMLSCGTNGFVFKTSDTAEIIQAIQEVLAGNHFLGSGVKELINGKNRVLPDLPVLTRRENEILVLIADGLTNQEIADKLFISCSTVDSHRKNLLLKFNVNNTVKLIRIALQQGIIS